MEDAAIVTGTDEPVTIPSSTIPAPLWALPGLVLAASGFFHPQHLTPSSAQTWWVLHVAGLFVFPLVGVALMGLLAGRRDPLAVLGTLAAFVYATAYSALDVLNGIGAGFVTSRLGAAAPRPDEVRSLFAIGSPLGQVGSWALILAAVVVSVDALLKSGRRALPGLVLLPGALLVHTDHIFWPSGALGMALVGIGTAWMAGTRRSK